MFSVYTQYSVYIMILHCIVYKLTIGLSKSREKGDYTFGNGFIGLFSKLWFTVMPIYDSTVKSALFYSLVSHGS